MNKSRPFTAHVTVELLHDFKSYFESEKFFDNLIIDLKLNVIDSIKHVFPNGGMTKLCILSTSHIALHTWPEVGYIHIDLLYCNKDITDEDIKASVEKNLKKSSIPAKYLIRKI